MEFKGSQTEKNLMRAFAGESQARNRYTFFASKAKKEGLEQMAAIFEETADQEKEHAERFFNFLQGGEVEITDSYPAGKVGTTMENLAQAAGGEHHEWAELYPSFAKTAREEGFEAIAKTFEHIVVAEKRHEARYLAMLDVLNKGESFKRGNVVIWRCRNCGYIEEGTTAPKVCPACAHPQSYFEVSTGLLSL
ncbi:MAG TPA: rubrerythrin family protein [Bacteriovoracaceae bacterium]|nr:rubrerythrin family protein [Bacteriovoracaceae bacterium]